MRPVTLLCLLISGCAALQGDASKSAGPKPAAEGEDSGVNNISRQLRDFNQALATKQFEAAIILLAKIDQQMSRASDLTRSHPDFEDLTEEVGAAHTKLDREIEIDRIRRRNEAIDATIHKGQQLLAQGVSMFQELKQRVPTAEDVQTLKEIVANLSKLRADGREYEDESRYRAHAALLDPKLQAVEARRRQAEWQLKATTATAEPIEAGYDAAQAIHSAGSAKETIALFQKVTAGFVGCVNALADLEHDPDYRDDWLIETRLGVLTVAETKRQCTDRAAKGRREADWRDWQERVNAAIAVFAPPLQRARAAKRAADALPAAVAAAQALHQCQTGLDAVAKHPGARDAQTFATLLGNLNAGGLRQACAAEETRYTKLQPGLKWALRLDEVAVRLEATVAQMDKAGASKDPGAQVELWRAVLGGFKECAETATKVGGEPGADKGLLVETVFGKVGVQALAKECGKRAGAAEASLKKAVAAQELAQFVATCKADEVSVAEREGIPTRVEPVSGGRVFIYERPHKGKAANTVTFGFDPSGKRVDFRVRWLDDLTTMVGELNRAVEATKAAVSGKDALKATQALLPVLSACRDNLDKTEKHPGYDADAVFTTALGKLTAAKLREVCATEKGARASTLGSLGWRVRLEELRDRVMEATAELGKAQTEADTKAKLARLATAIGGFTECVERATALPSEPGADKKIKVKIAKGEVDLAGIRSSCTKDLELARKLADRAGADQALAEFIAGCVGDEAEVARREGVPTRVEKRAAGRLFIYDARGKVKARRFAFNNDGRRVDEKAIGAAPTTAK
ncbi:MAG: hypothetical protein HY903_06265 [Deltaproteobacteria bacterium]|nr:hypothetical protein [Deltaproteobacteria bacterium]